jgi:hypothetical protein
MGICCGGHYPKVRAQPSVIVMTAEAISDRRDEHYVALYIFKAVYL